MRDVRKLNPVRSMIMSEISMREMLEAGVHFGHQTRYWNPKMAAYLFGHRNKIHIIDLEKTKVLLQEALNYVSKLSANKGTILFVGTKRAAQQIIKEEALRCSMPYINLRWLGGLLTNYKTVKQSINRLRELEEMKTDGSMERMSKKEILHFDRELEKLDRNLSGIKDMNGWPDALFVIDVGYEDIAISEAVKLKIPVVGIVDSNNSPLGVDYVIPGNDDAIRSIRLYTKAVADAILTGKDSVAHLGESGDKDEFVELDAEGAPIVEAKREKVQVKKKIVKKKISKTAESKTDSGAAKKDGASPETQSEEPAIEAGQTGTGRSEVSRDSAINGCVRQVPKGNVATYGQIANQVGAGCSSQQVGVAMRRLPDDSDVPWQRIIGSKGELKERSGQKGHEEQRRLLEEEGITFSPDDKVDLKQYQYSWKETAEETGVAVKQDDSAPEVAAKAEQDDSAPEAAEAKQDDSAPEAAAEIKQDDSPTEDATEAKQD